MSNPDFRNKFHFVRYFILQSTKITYLTPELTYLSGMRFEISCETGSGTYWSSGHKALHDDKPKLVTGVYLT